MHVRELVHGPMEIWGGSSIALCDSGARVFLMACWKLSLTADLDPRLRSESQSVKRRLLWPFGCEPPHGETV